MAFLTISKAGKGFYIYGSISQRRESDGLPIRYSKCLGKIDPETNSPVFNNNYLPWMQENNLPVETALSDYISRHNKFGFIDLSNYTIKDKASKSPLLQQITLTIDELKNINVKLSGATYLLKHISDSVGLTDILKYVFPLSWREILSLTFFYTTQSEALMYCQFFIDFFDELSVPEDLTSQKISKLFSSITNDERLLFYDKWSNHIKEFDFIALDNTSISTYSSLNEDADFGYPKQHQKKKTKQINVCLLFGQKTGLPIYLTTYNGSVNDVTAFINCAKKYNLLYDNNFSLVLDRGMYSKKNLFYMLDNKIKFIIGLPATTNYKNNLINDFQHIYLDINHSICSHGNNIYGVSKRILWENSKNLIAHIFLDQNKFIEEHNKIQDNIIQLYNNAVKNPLKYINDDDYVQFISFRRRNNSIDEYIVKKNQSAFKDLLSKCGWFVFLSNQIKDTTEALNIYRQRDIVEKAFNILKNKTIAGKTTVHSSNSYKNKSFIGFLSLILTSQIHKTMVDNNLYKDYTIDEIYFHLKSLKKINIKNYIVYSPLTSKHKYILDLFKCPLPIDTI